MAMPTKLPNTDCCPDACPKAGEVYVCKDCQMTIMVVKGCGCSDCECVCLACCGKAMKPVNC